MHIAPRQSPSEFLNITVSRTHQNTGLVVQWSLTVPPPPGTIFTYYQIQYRTAGREPEEEQVEASQRWLFVDKLDDAQGYEVHTYM